jgi:ankyrin repeat protein
MAYRFAQHDEESSLTDAERDDDLQRRFFELRHENDEVQSLKQHQIQLHNAVYMNDLSTINTLLNLPRHLAVELVNKVNVVCGCPLLFIACTNDTKKAGQTVELLLKSGANPNILDREGNSPLFEAIRLKSLLVCKVLLMHGADPSYTDPFENTPLKSAQLLNDSGTCFMKCLLKHGADASVRYRTGNTLLHHAVIGGVSDLLLVSPNAVNDQDRYVISPNVAEVRLLLATCFQKFTEDQTKAFLEAKNPDGATVLHLAARANDETVMMLLLRANQEAKNKYGWESEYLEATNKHGGTPLHNACREGSIQIVEMLLHFGAKTDAQNEWGDTPLHLAAREYRPDVIKEMLEAGANPGTKNLKKKAAITKATADRLLEDAKVI